MLSNGATWRVVRLTSMGVRKGGGSTRGLTPPQWLHDSPQILMSEEVILSAVNRPGGKPLGGGGSAPNPAAGTHVQR